MTDLETLAFAKQIIQAHNANVARLAEATALLERWCTAGAAERLRVNRATREWQTSRAPAQSAAWHVRGKSVELAPAQPAALTWHHCYCSDRMSSGLPCPPGQCPNVPQPAVPEPSAECAWRRNGDPCRCRRCDPDAEPSSRSSDDTLLESTQSAAFEHAALRESAEAQLAAVREIVESTTMGEWRDMTGYKRLHRVLLSPPSPTPETREDKQ